MTRRVLIEPGRVLMTKAGVEANPTGTPDEGKIFDSDWGFTGTIIASGQYADPAPQDGGEINRTTSSAQMVIPLPSFFKVRDYLVDVLYKNVRSVPVYSGSSWNTQSKLTYGYYSYLSHWVVDEALNALVLARDQNGSGFYRYDGVFTYQVYAV